MLTSGEVAKVNVKSLDGQEYFALSEKLDNLLKLRKAKEKLQILSPFDNLIIQRDRIKRLFNFDYTLECYTPTAKRKHGYFVLPILYGENLIGRFDPKADRARRTLQVKNLFLEDGFKPDEAFLWAFAERLKQMARFNNCEKIAIVSAKPIALKKSIASLLK